MAGEGDPTVFALAALDRALAARPHGDGDAFSEATRHLCVVRDRLAQARVTTPETRWRLERINAVISVVLAGHFPLGAVPWGELEKARDWLAEIVVIGETMPVL
jgi:hypothetical protein